MKQLHELSLDAPDILIREAFIDSQRETPDALEALMRENTPIDVLVKIGDSLPWIDYTCVAPLLANHPNMDQDIYDRIMESLKILWWDDDPTPCKLAWEALESVWSERSSKASVIT